jgi:hypothetical protein
VSISYALLISLLISKLFCTKGDGGGGGEGESLEGVGPENHIKTHNMQYRIQNTETAAAKLMYIKLPVYLFFILRLDSMILMGANPVLGSLEGVGLFQGPRNGFASRAI